MGQQQSNLSKEVSDVLVIRVSLDEKINLEEKQIEIKESNIIKGELGTFALEFIPKGTIFMYSGTGSVEDNKKLKTWWINDLAYNGKSEEYDFDDNIKKNINVGFVKQADQMYNLFGEGKIQIYLYAIKDINIGEELSKYYGLDYWERFEFWNKHNYSKFQETYLSCDLPTEYVYITSIRHNIHANYHMDLYGKKVDDKYYYLVGNGEEYYKKNFFDKKDENGKSLFSDVTKPDFSEYKINEVINDMYADQYLYAEYEKEKDKEKEKKECTYDNMI